MTLKVENQKTLGYALCERTEQIYLQTKTLQRFCQEGVRRPAHLGCSIISLLGGIGSAYQGNYFSGSIAAFFGVRELWNICSEPPKDHLLKLLSNIQADAGMVKTLEEANRESYKNLAHHLEGIKENIGQLSGQLVEIEQINANGVNQIEAKKLEAQKCNAAAADLFQQAGGCFQKALNFLQTSDGQFSQCAENLQLIDQIVKSEDPNTSLEDKIRQLLEVSGNASQHCISGKGLLAQMMTEMQDGLNHYQEANKLKDRALKISSQAVQEAEDALKAGLEKARYTTDCEQIIAQAGKELKKVQNRSDQILKLIRELKEDLLAAQQEARSKLDLGDVALGTTVAAALGPYLSLGYAAAAGVSAAYSWHNGTTLASTTKSVYNFMFGVPKTERKPLAENELLRLQFDKQSSGYFGCYVMGRESHTVGDVQIRLNKEDELVVRFNLENRDKIAKQDLLDLYECLNQRVSDGSVKPDQCLEILHQLKTVVIDRGKQSEKGPNLGVVKGLIKEQDSAYCIFAMLEELCEAKLSKNN